MRFIQKMFILVLMGTAAIPITAQPQPVRVPIPEGWSAVDEQYHYDRSNLWEYIDGAAELFLSYGFHELGVLDVEMGDHALTISLYVMGSPLDAFGVYERERPDRGDELEGVGAAAILQPPYRGLFLKDRFYVKVDVGGEDISAARLEKAMRDIADALPGNNDLPDRLSALPPSGRVPGSVAFSGRDFLGLSDLRDCLYATYQQDDGSEYRLFIMIPSRGFLRDKDHQWRNVDNATQGLFIWREIPYAGVVVMRGDEKQLLGVAGFDDLQDAITLLESVQIR